MAPIEFAPSPVIDLFEYPIFVDGAVTTDLSFDMSYNSGSGAEVGFSFDRNFFAGTLVVAYTGTFAANSTSRVVLARFYNDGTLVKTIAASEYQVNGDLEYAYFNLATQDMPEYDTVKISFRVYASDSFEGILTTNVVGLWAYDSLQIQGLASSAVYSSGSATGVVSSAESWNISFSASSGSAVDLSFQIKGSTSANSLGVVRLVFSASLLDIDSFSFSHVVKNSYTVRYGEGDALRSYYVYEFDTFEAVEFIVSGSRSSTNASLFYYDGWSYLPVTSYPEVSWNRLFYAGIQNLYSGLSGWFSQLFSNLSNWFTQLFTKLGNWFDSVISAVKDGFASIGEKLDALVNGTQEQQNAAQDYKDSAADQAGQIDQAVSDMNVAKPNAGDLDMSLNTMTGGMDFSYLNSAMLAITSSGTVYQCLIIAVTLMLVSYVLFGKKR